MLPRHTFLAAFQQYLAGPTYALRWGDSLRVGASLFASYASSTVDQHDMILDSEIVGGADFPTTLNGRAQIDAYSVGGLRQRRRCAPQTRNLVVRRRHARHQ